VVQCPVETACRSSEGVDGVGNMPVVCGWRRSVVEARARKLLYKEVGIKDPQKPPGEVPTTQSDVGDVNNLHRHPQ